MHQKYKELKVLVVIVDIEIIIEPLFNDHMFIVISNALQQNRNHK